MTLIFSTNFGDMPSRAYAVCILRDHYFNLNNRVNLIGNYIFIQIRLMLSISCTVLAVGTTVRVSVVILITFSNLIKLKRRGNH